MNVLRCDYCAEPAIAAAPGSEPVRELFLLARGEPMRCWCLSCWQRCFGKAAAA